MLKKRIKGSLFKRIYKLNKKNRLLKKEINKLKEDIEKQKIRIKELKDINFEISSNNAYLCEQRKRTNKRIKQIKIELEELKLKERLNNGKQEGRK